MVYERKISFSHATFKNVSQISNMTFRISRELIWIPFAVIHSSNYHLHLTRKSYIIEWRIVFPAVEKDPLKSGSYFGTNSHKSITHYQKHILLKERHILGIRIWDNLHTYSNRTYARKMIRNEKNIEDSTHIYLAIKTWN